MPRFVEAKIVTNTGEVEYLAMDEITAQRILREGQAPEQFHTNAGEFYEVESITIEGQLVNSHTSSE